MRAFFGNVQIELLIYNHYKVEIFISVTESPLLHTENTKNNRLFTRLSDS